MTAQTSTRSLYDHRMADPSTQQEKLCGYVTRSKRNEWAEQLEELVRRESPYPIAYDVMSFQPTNFSEYTYTEVFGGIWPHTQCIEINARLLDMASKVECGKDLSELAGLLEDKYNLEEVPLQFQTSKRVCFLPGHNAFDIASLEVISRLAHEEEDVVFKPHPLTGEEALRMLRGRFGAHRIVPRNVSGFQLLKNCEEAYVSSASEMAITGTVLGKKVVNVSNFNTEGKGAYHPISRPLFLAHRRQGVAEAQRLLTNMIYCQWSGLIFPFHADVEARVKAYYAKSLELKGMYRPLASPIELPKSVQPPKAATQKTESQQRRLVPLAESKKAAQS